jgi:hypothetical protein
MEVVTATLRSGLWVGAVTAFCLAEHLQADTVAPAVSTRALTCSQMTVVLLWMPAVVVVVVPRVSVDEQSNWGGIKLVYLSTPVIFFHLLTAQCCQKDCHDSHFFFFSFQETLYFGEKIRY